MKSQSSQGGGKRLPWRVPTGAGASVLGRQQGQGETPGSSHGLDVARVSPRLPPRFSEVIKGSGTSPGGRASLQQLTVTITYASLY